MIHLKAQPAKSNLCGQTCVAMIANISIEKAASLMDKKGLTGKKHLERALRKLNFKCGETVRVSKKRGYPNT